MFPGIGPPPGPATESHDVKHVALSSRADPLFILKNIDWYHFGPGGPARAVSAIVGRCVMYDMYEFHTRATTLDTSTCKEWSLYMSLSQSSITQHHYNTLVCRSGEHAAQGAEHECGRR